jgi:hypothetical protein
MNVCRGKRHADEEQNRLTLHLFEDHDPKLNGRVAEGRQWEEKTRL